MSVDGTAHPSARFERLWFEEKSQHDVGCAAQLLLLRLEAARWLADWLAAITSECLLVHEPRAGLRGTLLRRGSSKELGL